MSSEHSPSEQPVRTVLFHRKYRRFHGGHLKVWHYFNHVLATPGFDARVLFDADSSWDSSNPWTNARDRVIDVIDGLEPAALFVAGRDWQRLERSGLLGRDLPILNLIQHVRHAEEWSIQSRYLGQKAIRLCVSQEVADAVTAAGSHGPTVVIPNGVDVPSLADIAVERPLDLLIAGLKQPALATRIAGELAVPGCSIEIFTEHVAREAFLDAMRRARVTLFLPNEEEGFYLPALEGMALGTLVVCPDCIGNRSFCLPALNAFRPAYQFDDLLAATRSALALSDAEAAEIKQNATETARRHSLEAEREAFGRVLADLDALWSAS
jgi:glycosyltransferase involved in cell wall biosynthesis